jgi:DNA-binding NarL/FixJ family response regulator
MAAPRPGIGEAARYRTFAMADIRVVLAEDNALLREGISRIIDGEPDFELVGRAADLPELLTLIESESPQVVDEGIQAASWLREHKPGVGVVVLSQYKTPSYALALLETGSAGRAYLLKEQVAGADELAQAIRIVAQEGSMIDPQIVDELIEAKSSRRRSDLSWLTPRESEILGEMATGKSNAAIAASLQVSERAVEKHTNSIFSKLGLSEERDVNRRVKAVLVYLSDPGGG